MTSEVTGADVLFRTSILPLRHSDIMKIGQVITFCWQAPGLAGVAHICWKVMTWHVDKSWHDMLTSHDNLLVKLQQSLEFSNFIAWPALPCSLDYTVTQQYHYSTCLCSLKPLWNNAIAFVRWQPFWSMWDCFVVWLHLCWYHGLTLIRSGTSVAPQMCFLLKSDIARSLALPFSFICKELYRGSHGNG
jgi:hypothetical protein